MKVLLTGATGLIGKEVGKLLVAKGHEVVAVSRSASRAKSELPFKATCVEWAGSDAAFDRTVMESVDAVINLMGENLVDQRWSADFKKKISDSRILGTRALVESASQSKKLQTWIQGSAIGFYGEAKDATIFDEASLMGEGFLPELCQAWESETAVLPKSVRTAIVRTGIVFSHQGGAFPQMFTPLMNGLGGNLGSGRQKMSLIHLDDMAALIVHLLETATARGVYNGVAATPISQKELTDQLCQSLNVNRGPSVPAFALRLAIGEMANSILENQPVISTRQSEVGFKLKYPSVDQIVKEVTSWHHNPIHPEQSAFVMYSEQFVAQPLDHVFTFFSDAHNLEKLTPDFLKFKIEKVSTPTIEKNTRISYSLKIHSVPVTWLTDIAVWDPPHRFVDNQLKGPYSLWYHEHQFEAVEGGTLMKDWIRYRLPLGKLGQFTALSKVKSDIAEIFKHRRRVIAKEFS
jgi:uncharacterized protein (TIGR01777 family)